MKLGSDEIFGPPVSLMNQPSSGGFDWSGALQTIVKTAGTVYQAKTQADIAKAQAQAAAANPWMTSFGGAEPIPSGLMPSAFPPFQYPTQMRVPSQMGSNDTWLMVGIGAVAILAILTLSK
jgi:hypothetical protein